MGWHSNVREQTTVLWYALKYLSFYHAVKWKSKVFLARFGAGKTFSAPRICWSQPLTIHTKQHCTESSFDKYIPGSRLVFQESDCSTMPLTTTRTNKSFTNWGHNWSSREKNEKNQADFSKTIKKKHKLKLLIIDRIKSWYIRSHFLYHCSIKILGIRPWNVCPMYAAGKRAQVPKATLQNSLNNIHASDCT